MADGTESAEIIYDDPECLAITPLRVMAPTHVLVFPRAHYDGLPYFLEREVESVGRLMRRAAEIAAQRGLNERGYRLVWNFGPDTKQRITHPHLHLLGGTLLREELA
ncbi:MAG: HIT domain-containing protein [Brevibacterium sp.]|nr:HIT domain-containing protein [Brevibacterium sp.]